MSGEARGRSGPDDEWDSRWARPDGERGPSM